MTSRLISSSPAMTNKKHKAAIYWFRQDLRIDDNPTLIKACANVQTMVFVYCHPPQKITRWGFPSNSPHRRHFIDTALANLRKTLVSLGSDLLEIDMSAAEALPGLASELQTTAIYCEDIAAPEEQDEVAALRVSGLDVSARWQSSLLSPADLPFKPTQLPEVFTQFRTTIEKAGVLPLAPCAAPASIPPLPAQFSEIVSRWHKPVMPCPTRPKDQRSSFPYFDEQFSGAASAAKAHLDQYLARKLAHTYKQTRNQLTGVDYSTKFSPWLACGAISARQIYHALKEFETEYGANDSSYWIWFELLWRDYFRLLHLQYGRRLYTASGLSTLPAPLHDTVRFTNWCQAQTGEALVDAGMAELAATGYLSNRLRQIVASYLIYDLDCDWRAGAAWFEAQLVDYDVYSNQGNWLYIAGRGTDPRNGRRFNVQKQVHDHDRDGTYRQLWLTDLPTMK
ncbi:DASH family cryptochrome [Undibacterium sp. RuRC25W]|uniref:DASH family cryptochrome n=1 Tax=Undibacterium sp. RuRC25W TaxID=3413047 RepID=UPI003BF10D4F